MTATTQQPENATTLEALASRAATGADAWLGELKAAGAARFAALGLPTTSHEDWRYTNIDPIRKATFVTPNGETQALAPGDIAAYDIPELTGPLAVFVDGRYVAELSNVGGLPAGVRAVALSEAVTTDRKIVERHLGKIAKYEDEAFAALNTACIEEGLFVYVPAGVTVPQPIRALSIATDTADTVITNPRNLIVAEDDAKVTVIEQYVARAENVYFTNAVTEIEAGHRAQVSHYILEQESEKAYNVSTLAIHQGDHSDVASHTMMFGGAIVRNNVNPQLDGDTCLCLINGMYAPTGNQLVDNHMRVEHLKEHGDSRQFYKGILLDHSRAVFSGRIIVSEGAQKTDAKQTNANLLLSDDAQVNTKPQLEIYADDVKCTHGATIGQLDEDALFYLESRGISKEAARGLMVYSFAAETFERIDCEPVRKFLERMLISRLPQGSLLENVLQLDCP